MENNFMTYQNEISNLTRKGYTFKTIYRLNTKGVHFFGDNESIRWQVQIWYFLL